MASDDPTRVQICGGLVATVGGRRIESLLPGRQGRLAFVYLTLHRLRTPTRDELVEALWPQGPPAAADQALAAIVSKIRRAVGADLLVGRGDVRLVLPEGARVDLEVARAAAHRAESAVAAGDWPRAWAASQTALFTARRGFLPGEDSPWADEVRRSIHGLHVRALEAYGQACLRFGGAERAAALRVGDEMVALVPYRESGHRLLIEAHVALGNRAEALRAYESLRVRLREDLGMTPTPELQELHRRLLVDAAADRPEKARGA